MARGRSAPAARSAPASRPRPAPSAAPASSSSVRAAPQPASSHAPPPAHAPGAPPPAPVQSSSGGGMFSGIMGTVVQGASFGVGSSLGHRAVDAMLGPRGASEPAPAAAPEPAAAAAPTYTAPMQYNQESPCSSQQKAFADCMTKNDGNMAACQFYFDMMKECKMSNMI